MLVPYECLFKALKIVFQNCKNYGHFSSHSTYSLSFRLKRFLLYLYCNNSDSPLNNLYYDVWRCENKLNDKTSVLNNEQELPEERLEKKNLRKIY